MKKSVFLIPAIVFLVCVFATLGTPAPYGEDNERFINILSTLKGLSADYQLFFGDSQMRENLDCTLIGNSCFNFALLGIVPSQMHTLLMPAMRSQPDALVIGISPLLFNEDKNYNPDYNLFIEDPAKFESDQELRQRKLHGLSRAFYERKFFQEAFFHLLFGGPKDSKDGRLEFKVPYEFTEDLPIEDLKPETQFAQSKRQQKQFLETLRLMPRESVILIDMPLHPLLREQLDVREYEAYLNQLNEEYTVYTARESFAQEYFSDLTHLNAEGRKKFSQMVKKRLHAREAGGDPTPLAG